MKRLIYSRLPRHSYSVFYNGEMGGIGVQPIFDQVPGAWNILWLTAAEGLEQLLDWDQLPGEFPTSFQAVPLCVATALQFANSSETFGQLAEKLPPRQLLQAMKASSTVPAIVQAYPDWYTVAEENARLFVNNFNNVIAVDFRSHEVN